MGPDHCIFGVLPKGEFWPPSSSPPQGSGPPNTVGGHRPLGRGDVNGPLVPSKCLRGTLDWPSRVPHGRGPSSPPGWRMVMMMVTVMMMTVMMTVMMMMTVMLMEMMR